MRLRRSKTKRISTPPTRVPGVDILSPPPTPILPKKIKIDTGNLCMFCLRECDRESRDRDEDHEINELCSRYIRMISRYLRINIFHKRSEYTQHGWLGMDHGKFEITPCENCLPLMKSFCDFYSEMEKIKLKLDYEILQMRKIMKYAERVPSRHKSFMHFYRENNQDEKRKFDEFRRQFIVKGLKTLGSPKVRIESIDRKIPSHSQAVTPEEEGTQLRGEYPTLKDCSLQNSSVPLKDVDLQDGSELALSLLKSQPKKKPLANVNTPVTSQNAGPISKTLFKDKTRVHADNSLTAISFKSRRAKESSSMEFLELSADPLVLKTFLAKLGEEKSNVDDSQSCPEIIDLCVSDDDEDETPAIMECRNIREPNNEDVNDTSAKETANRREERTPLANLCDEENMESTVFEGIRQEEITELRESPSKEEENRQNFTAAMLPPGKAKRRCLAMPLSRKKKLGLLRRENVNGTEIDDDKSNRGPDENHSKQHSTPALPTSLNPDPQSGIQNDGNQEQEVGYLHSNGPVLTETEQHAPNFSLPQNSEEIPTEYEIPTAPAFQDSSVPNEYPPNTFFEGHDQQYDEIPEHHQNDFPNGYANYYNADEPSMEPPPPPPPPMHTLSCTFTLTTYSETPPNLETFAEVLRGNNYPFSQNNPQPAQGGAYNLHEDLYREPQGNYANGPDEFQSNPTPDHTHSVPNSQPIILEMDDDDELTANRSGQETSGRTYIQNNVTICEVEERDAMQ